MQRSAVCLLHFIRHSLAVLPMAACRTMSSADCYCKFGQNLYKFHTTCKISCLNLSADECSYLITFWLLWFRMGRLPSDGYDEFATTAEFVKQYAQAMSQQQQAETASKGEASGELSGKIRREEAARR